MGNVNRFKPPTAGHDVHFRPFFALLPCRVRRIYYQVYSHGSLRARGERAKSEARAEAETELSRDRALKEHMEDPETTRKQLQCLRVCWRLLSPPPFLATWDSLLGD